nr:CAP domain-containing protein [Mycobacterium sp. E342]
MLAGLLAGAVLARTPVADADNKRLNDGVVANVYTVQHNAGCTNDVRINPQLQLAAQWHTDDVLANRALDGDIGSDGSTPQDRADAAGYGGSVAETVAINPALAMSGLEVINQWFSNPVYLAVMRNCAYTQMGVWSQNSLDRSVVVAMYGAPGARAPR